MCSAFCFPFSLLWLLQLSGLYFYFSPFPSTPVQFPCALTFVAPVEIHEVPPVLGFTGLATKPRAQWAHCYAPTAALDFRAINSCRSEMSWTPSINHRPPSSGDKTNNRQPNVKPRVKPGATKHPDTNASVTQNRGLYVVPNRLLRSEVQPCMTFMCSQRCCQVVSFTNLLSSAMLKEKKCFSIRLQSIKCVTLT